MILSELPEIGGLVRDLKRKVEGEGAVAEEEEIGAEILVGIPEEILAEMAFLVVMIGKSEKLEKVLYKKF